MDACPSRILFMKKRQPFNRENHYDATIAPLMAPVLAAAERAGIPMLACFCVGHEADGTDHLVISSLPDEKKWAPPEFIEANQVLQCGADTRAHLSIDSEPHARD
jgi:hypothetical protein